MSTPLGIILISDFDGEISLTINLTSSKSSLKITQSIFNKFINNGGSFILKKIDSVFKKNNNLILKSNNQEFQTDKVIIAAGVWSNNLAKTIKDNFPLDTERGYHITFKSDSRN